MDIDVETIYRKYGPMVLRRCTYLLKNEQKALDAMQDTFVKLLRYQNKLHTRALSSLLYRIATNVCLNIIRAETRKPNTLQDDILCQIACRDDQEQRFFHKDLINTIFQSERASTKTIAVLHYVDGLTLEQVSREVKLSVSGVRKRLRQLKSKLKEKKEVYL
ncbi:MAG: sigma-70 family RNA polymerase sigma factor [Spirochaetales bacterium]|nr:sigma-70 family RNA polymerase sigma factor [Spirochaetales bacterium]